MCKSFEETFHQRNYMHGKEAHEKMLYVITSDMQIKTVRSIARLLIWLKLERLTTANTGDDVKQSELLYNAKWE